MPTTYIKHSIPLPLLLLLIITTRLTYPDIMSTILFMAQYNLLNHPIMKQKKFQRRVLRVISEVKQTLTENNNDAKVIELATNFNVSRNSLQSAFMQECGESIRGYKLRIRMEQAIRMLEAEKDIKEIAITLNYTHSRNFSTAFKKYYGVVPTEWPTIVRNQSSLCESRPDKFGAR